MTFAAGLSYTVNITAVDNNMYINAFIIRSANIFGEVCPFTFFCGGLISYRYNYSGKI